MKPSEIFWSSIVVIIFIVLSIRVSHWFLSWIPFLLLLVYAIMNLGCIFAGDSWTLDEDDTEFPIKYLITYWLIIYPILKFNNGIDNYFTK